MSEKGRTEEFLDLYRKLEHIGREIYFPNSNNAPIIGRLQAIETTMEVRIVNIRFILFTGTPERAALSSSKAI